MPCNVRFDVNMSRNVRFYLSYDPKTTLKLLCFLHENPKILPYIRMQRHFKALQKSVKHYWFIDFNAWHYITPRRDVI